MTPEAPVEKRREPQPSMMVRRVIAIRGDGRILLLKRTADSHPNPGLLEFGGGKRNPYQLMFETARNELIEEASIACAPILGFEDYLFHIEKNYPPDHPKWPNLHYLEAVGIGLIRPGIIALGDEHTLYKYYTLETAIRRRNELTPEALIVLVSGYSVLKQCIKYVKSLNQPPPSRGGAILNPNAY